MRLALKVFVAGAAIAGSTLGAQIGTTQAVFTDSAVVSGNVFKTQAIAAPTGLTGSALCVLAVRSNTIQWNPVSTADSYAIERASGSGGSFLSLTVVTDTSYTDLDVLSGTYQYRIVAQRANWRSSPSATLTLTQGALCL